MGHSRDPDGPNLSIANPGKMLINSLKWQLPNLRDACLEYIFERDWRIYNFYGIEQHFIRALSLVGPKLLREEPRTQQKLANEAMSLWLNATQAMSKELKEACKQYLSKHAAEYKDVIDFKVRPSHNPYHQFSDEWDKACDFMQQAIRQNA